MTFVVKVRGAPSGPMTSEYDCPDHGRFEAQVDRSSIPDFHPCPDCSALSPWRISAPLFKPQRGAVAQGKIAESPHQLALDTRPLAEGMPLREWKKRRAAMWRDHDRPKQRELVEQTEKVLNAPDGVSR